MIKVVEVKQPVGQPQCFKVVEQVSKKSKQRTHFLHARLLTELELHHSGMTVGAGFYSIPTGKLSAGSSVEVYGWFMVRHGGSAYCVLPEAEVEVLDWEGLR